MKFIAYFRQNCLIWNTHCIILHFLDVVLTEESKPKPIDATTIALIAVAVSFGLLVIFIIAYFASAKVRKNRQRAREVKEQKFKLSHQYEIVVSKPSDPGIVKPSDIYMNYY